MDKCEFPRNIHSLPIAHGAPRIMDRRGGDAWRWRRHRVRRRNENSQNEPGMSAGINDIENRGWEGPPIGPGLGVAASTEGIGWRIHDGVCHVCVQKAARHGSHTSQKARRVRHPVAASTEGIGWRIHDGVCHVCVQKAARRASHTSRKARRMRHPVAASTRRDLGGAYMAVFAMCAFRTLPVVVRTQKARCMRHPGTLAQGGYQGLKPLASFVS